MTAVGWKIVCPSPKNEFLSPVGRMIDGMIARPRPLRVAFISRIFGCDLEVAEPLRGEGPVLACPIAVCSLGVLCPETIAIGRITPSSKPRCGRCVKPTAACSDGVDQVRHREVGRLGRRSSPFSTSGLRA